MNPEVIVAYKPTSLLDDEQTANVLALFREFVDNRGVCMDPREPLKVRTTPASLSMVQAGKRVNGSTPKAVVKAPRARCFMH